MKTVLLALSLGLLTTCSAFGLKQPKDANHPKVVQLGTQRRMVPRSDIRRRDQDPEVSLESSQQSVHYIINVTLGTPPQSFGLVLDTGSADFIVRTASSAGCRAGNCSHDGYGSFDTFASSSYTYLNKQILQSYGEGTTANGSLATDVLSFGGMNLPNFTFGAVDQFTISTNTFGLGYTTEEATYVASGLSYPNGPAAMKAAGVIESAAYSIWLNDINSGDGTILFGGVDTAKYSGKLQIVPILPGGTIPTNGPWGNAGQVVYSGIQISLNAVGSSIGGVNTISTPAGYPFTVTLDSGNTQNLLPAQLVTNLCTAFGCTRMSSGLNTIPCARNNGTISFNFSGANITVPLSQFVRDAGLGGGMCVFDVTATNGPSFYLGEPFLRGAYVVYNLDANELAMAPTLFNATASNVLEISNSSSIANGSSYYTSFGIPGAANASSIVTGSPSATGTIGPAVTNAGVRAVSLHAAGMLVAVAAAFMAL